MIQILFTFLPILGVVFGIIVIILTLLAINHLHRIPAILQSLENCEKYLKYLAIEKKKGETGKAEQSPPSQ